MVRAGAVLGLVRHLAIINNNDDDDDTTTTNNNMKKKKNYSICKAQNIVHRDYPERIHTHAHTDAPTHTSILTIQS